LNLAPYARATDKLVERLNLIDFRGARIYVMPAKVAEKREKNKRNEVS